MSLSQALATAMSGLRTNQASLALLSSNVANAETPGYVRKSLDQVATVTASYGASVRIAGVNRELDQYIQSQLRTETSGAAYAGVRTAFLSNLQSVYGDPASAGTLEYAFNRLTTAIQALSTSADSQSARIAVVNAAQTLAQQLNGTTQGIQSLRANAEAGLNDAVNTANNAMAQIANINAQLQRGGAVDASTAALLDQRDQYITQLSQVIDIRTVVNDANQVTVFTNSGVQLVGSAASVLSFNAQGTVTPNTLYNSDPAKSTVGTISISFPQGGSLDLVSTNAIRSGSIAAYLDLRDTALVKAQAQVDQLAAAMASALSDRTTAGAAVAPAPQAGFDLDLAGLQNGNTIHLSYLDNATGLTRKLSILRVEDSSVLPLPNTATLDPTDQVLGIDFSGGFGSVVSQLTAALGGAGLQFSNPSGATLRVLDDGLANTIDITAASITKTMSSLTSGVPEFALFTDGGRLYTGAFTASGPQQAGFAGRISVNTALLGDPSRVVVFGTSPATAAGDSTRPEFMLAKLSNGIYAYSADTGMGSPNAPFKGTLLNFTQHFLSAQGDAASAAQQLSDGQNVVLNTLQKKMDATSGVDIDEEMAHLLVLQSAYAANARVMSTIKEMYASLLQAM